MSQTTRRRRQTFVTVQPYDEMPYWAEAGIWEPADENGYGCVSLDPFGTNRMAAEWAAADDADDDADSKGEYEHDAAEVW